MQPLQPRMKNIEMVKQGEYAARNRMSQMCDAAILPREGGMQYKRTAVMSAGGYKNIDSSVLINEKKKILKFNNNVKTNTTAKMPVPVKVSKYKQVQQQVAINLINPDIVSLDQLTPDQQYVIMGGKRYKQPKDKNVLKKLLDIKMKIPDMV